MQRPSASTRKIATGEICPSNLHPATSPLAGTLRLRQPLDLGAALELSSRPRSMPRMLRISHAPGNTSRRSVECPRAAEIRGRQPRPVSLVVSSSLRGVPSGLVGVEDEFALRSRRPRRSAPPVRGSSRPRRSPHSRSRARRSFRAGNGRRWRDPRTCRNSRRGVPVPHTGTLASPRCLASCTLRSSAGSTCEVLQVEVVARAVEIGRHGADEIAAVLARVGLAELDAGDLGQRVGFVRRLQRAGEQRVLGDRLRREFRVDARAARERAASPRRNRTPPR